MKEQLLPLTQAPDILELRLAETFNSPEHSEILKTIERLPYSFNIVNLKSTAKEKKKPNPGKVYLLSIVEFELLKKKIRKWKDSWFILLENDFKKIEIPDVENLIILDAKTIEQIPAILNLINAKFCEYKKGQLEELAIKNTQILGKDAVRFLENLYEAFRQGGESSLTPAQLNGLTAIDSVLDYYGDFFVIEEKAELDKLLKEIVSQIKIVKSIHLYEDPDDLLEEDKGGGMILPLVSGGKMALALYRFPKNISPIAPFYTFLIHSLIAISFSKIYPGLENEENTLWEESFSNLPFPCALVNKSGELLLHNPLFSKLNLSPASLGKVRNREKIEVRNEIFELNRIDINRNEQMQSLLILNSNNVKMEKSVKTNKSSSSEELGIISSSIAHELNNPLAGILATISVLGLEDEWLEDPEVSQALGEMNQSARRCKDLIEIFLGFSRAHPNRGDAYAIDEIFLKSLELIRFRTIESNARFEFDLKKKSGKFKREINSSVVSMMFYLILNEILTSFSHHKLVSHDEDNVFRGSFNEYPSKVVIEMEKDFNFQVSIGESKLIQHLLDLIGMSLQVEERRIILSEWTLT